MDDCCGKFPQISITIVDIKGKCPILRNVGVQYTLEDFHPPGLCLSAFHSIYPYAMTLSHEGRFGWLKSRDIVIAQCPNPNIAIGLELNRVGKTGKKVSATVIQARGKCHKKMNLGDKFIIDLEDQSGLCKKAFYSFLPYIIGQNPDKKIEDIVVSCPNYPDNVTFKITFNSQCPPQKSIPTP